MALQASRDVIVRSSRFAEAVAFYRDTLQLPVVFEAPHLVGFETGAFRLYVEAGADHGPVFEFMVAHVADARDRLLAQGCVLVEEDPAVPRCYLRDPHGMTFNLRARPGGGA